MRLIMGRLRLHWLAQSSNSTMSNSVRSISGKSPGWFATCWQMASDPGAGFSPTTGFIAFE
jgi:hypothetical protein